MKSTLCFIHNHKVAGTAIRYAVMEHLQGRFHWYDMPEMEKHWKDLAPAEVARFELVAGHLPRTEFDAKVPGDKIYFCLVREPVRRAISLFEYIVNGWDEQHPWRASLREKGLAWAIQEHEGFRRQALNDQCRMLSGLPTFESALESINDGRWILDTSSNVEAAWTRACKVMGWPTMPLQRVIEGRASYFEDLATPDVIAALTAANQEDLKLFDYVLRSQSGFSGHINRMRTLIINRFAPRQ